MPATISSEQDAPTTFKKYSSQDRCGLLQKAGLVKCYITDKASFCRGKIGTFLIIPAGLPGIK